VNTPVVSLGSSTVLLLLLVVLGGSGCRTVQLGTRTAPGSQREYLCSTNALSLEDVQRIARYRRLGMGVMWDPGLHGLFVPTSYHGETVEVGVIASPDDDSVAGIRHMDNGDWLLAVDCFARCLTHTPRDHLVIFAFAVCDEKLGEDVALLVACLGHEQFVSSPPSANRRFRHGRRCFVVRGRQAATGCSSRGRRHSERISRGQSRECRSRWV
jgi:hypothetical protein